MIYCLQEELIQQKCPINITTAAIHSISILLQGRKVWCIEQLVKQRKVFLPRLYIQLRLLENFVNKGDGFPYLVQMFPHLRHAPNLPLCNSYTTQVCRYIWTLNTNVHNFAIWCFTQHERNSEQKCLITQFFKALLN